jgi:hypothetical protein
MTNPKKEQSKTPKKKAPVKRKKKELTFEEKTEEYKAQALKLIEEKALVFLEDVVAFMPICKKTFYNYGLHDLHEIREAIDNNKVCTKHNMRQDWLQSDSAPLQLGLYKLLGTREERLALSNSVENTIVQNITVSDMSAEEIEKKRAELLEKIT